MNKKSVMFIVISWSCCSLIYAGPHNAFGDFKSDLVALFHVADQQRELVRAWLEHKDVDMTGLSLQELSATISKLEEYRELLIAQKNRHGRLNEQESRCLSLTQELIRQLTNARFAYEEKIKQSASVKKVAISAGAAVTVFGGLMLLKALTPLEISVQTAAACGLLTGCVVGAVSYYRSGVKIADHV